jgi:hypothetical protein
MGKARREAIGGQVTPVDALVRAGGCVTRNARGVDLRPVRKKKGSAAIIQSHGLLILGGDSLIT